jgi:hypothetical protein
MTGNARGRALRWALVSVIVFFGLGFTFDEMPVWMTPDSVEYLAMADSLAAGEGVRGFDGQPTGMWGPGFPALLAPAIAFGIDAFDALPWLHAWIWTLLLLGVVVPLAWQLGSWRWRWPLLVGILIGAPVITVTSSMLADATLVAGVLGCTFLAERVRRGARPWGLIVLASLLPLVELIGVMVWPAVLWAMWTRPRARWTTAVLVALPLVAWSIRNLATFGQISERFPGEPLGFASVFRGTSAELTNWFLPRLASTDVLLASGALSIVVLLFAWRRLGRPPLPGRQTPWLLTAGSFLVLFWVSSTTRRVDLPDARVLAPLFVIALVLASRLGAALQGRSNVPVMVIGIFWTGLIGVQGVLATQHHLLAPQAAYFDQEDRFAAIVKTSVPDVEPGVLVWSNVPEFVYWQTGHPSQWTEPAHLEAGLGGPGTPVRAVWFAFSPRGGLVHPRDFAQVDWQEPIIRLDVELWRGVVR